MKVICVTGTPGTGKTTLSKKLAKKLKFVYFDVNGFISKNRLSDGFDIKRKSKIIDTKRLNSAIIKELNSMEKEKYNGAIIDSHLSHYLPKKLVKLCIVVRCNIKELSRRLSKRKYSKTKIDENLQAEIFDVCGEEARLAKHKVLVADTSKSFNINDLAKKLGG
jgi:adenylate kinase